MPAQSFQSIVSKIIPPLLSSFHKGQAGRVVVIGGCEDYTGAPYFAAHAATSLGCDMSHIICEKSAGQIIKTYSPNLMVHPYLYDSRTIPDGVTEDSVVERAASILDRVHAVVIGPGLGRDPLLLSLTEKIIAEVKKRSLPLVIDADGLYLIQSKPEIITGYKNAVLTPNVVELKRLFKSVESVSVKSEKHEPAVAILARKFGGVTVISKGEIDGISNGKDTVECRAQGGRKRVSGQGDTLSGCLGTFLAWRAAYHQGLWTTPELNESYTLLLAAYGASEVTRTSSYLAFEKKGRSTLTSDIGEQVGAAYTQLYASKVNRVK